MYNLDEKVNFKNITKSLGVWFLKSHAPEAQEYHLENLMSV